MDAVVKRVLRLCPELYSAGKYEELLLVVTQTLTYIATLSPETIVAIRRDYALSDRPIYHKKGDKLHHPKLVTLLDYRATVYEKIGGGLRQNAIKDARAAIDADPYSPKGYIRLVKLYKQVSTQRAEEVGEAGLRRLHHGVHKYKLQLNQRSIDILRNMVAELTATRKRKKAEEAEREAIRNKKLKTLNDIPVSVGMEPSPTLPKPVHTKNLDIMNILPFETIELIFSYLQTKQALRLLPVSRTWYVTISQLSIFYKITMRSLTSLRDLQSCLRLVNKRTIHKMSLPSIRRTDESKVLKLLISNSEVKITESLLMQFNDTGLRQVVQQLSAGNNHTLDKLRKLTLTCAFDLNFEYELLKLLPKLQSLTLSSTQCSPSQVTSPTIKPSLFQNLSALQIYGNNTKLIPFQKLFEWDGCIYPNVRVLVVGKCNFQQINNTNQHSNFLNKFPNLVQLKFEMNEGYSFQQVLTNINEFHSLQLFQISEVSCAKYNIFTNFLINQQIFQNNIQFIFQNLLVLNLSHSSIQFSALIKILGVATGLQKLEIGRCPNLHFKPGPFSQIQQGTFIFDEFVKYAYNLKTVALNESLNFNDFSITELIQAMKKNDGLKLLKNLDLSNNLNVSGYMLLELVKMRPLDVLVINGLDVRVDTIKLMESQKFVRRVERKVNSFYRSYRG